MSQQHKYLVTTNALTGEIESVEQLGSGGELIAVDPATLLGSKVAPARAGSSERSEVAAAPGVFLGSERPVVRGEEPAAPGVFFGSPELPTVHTEAAATPGVFFHGPEIPDIRTEAAAPGIFYHGPELPVLDGSATR